MEIIIQGRGILQKHTLFPKCWSKHYTVYAKNKNKVNPLLHKAYNLTTILRYTRHFFIIYLFIIYFHITQYITDTLTGQCQPQPIGGTVVAMII